MNKKNAKRLAAMIRELGAHARRLAAEMPEGEDRDITWSCFASAITGAAIHDGNPADVMDILATTVVGMTGAYLIEKATERGAKNAAT